jgi:hypothetical protein
MGGMKLNTNVIAETWLGFFVEQVKFESYLGMG